MADENDRFVLRIEDQSCRGHVAFERQSRILNDADVVAAVLQDVIDPLPAGSVRETAVDDGPGLTESLAGAM
jgi:hypothetical protein